MLELQLTIENDPHFLFHLTLNEQEFHDLKQQQTLLVDFLQFPHKVVELLQECIKEQSQSHPKFICQLLQSDDSLWSFSVIETNTFKHINHLSLRFTPGNDFTIKNYLAVVVSDLKQQRSTLEQELAGNRARLEHSTAAFEQIKADLENTKAEFQEQICKLNLDHANQLAEERQKNLVDIEETRRLIQSDAELQRRNFEEQVYHDSKF